MLISEFSSPSDPVITAVEVASAVASLPAVATQDWCSCAAASLRTLRAQAIVSVSLATVGVLGTILVLEATGAVGSDPFGRALEGEVIHPEHAASFDWWIDEESPSADTPARAALLRDLRCAAVWDESPAGRRWGKLGVTDLIVGTAPMAGEGFGRALVIELGARGGGTFSLSEAAIVRAALPLLGRRAMLAFGTERSTVSNRITHKEQQVLDHLALGKSVKQIACDLGRSPHTVHDHMKSLHRKLNASSRGELISRALGHLASRGRPGRLQLEAVVVESVVPALLTA